MDGYISKPPSYEPPTNPWEIGFRIGQPKPDAADTKKALEEAITFVDGEINSGEVTLILGWRVEVSKLIQAVLDAHQETAKAKNEFDVSTVRERTRSALTRLREVVRKRS